MEENEAYGIHPPLKHAQEGPTFNERLPSIYNSQPYYSTVNYASVGQNANVGSRHIVNTVEYEVPVPYRSDDSL